MNVDGKRSLPDDVQMGFIPEKLKPFVENGDGINRQAWEYALLLSMREEIKSGNITVDDSKRFGDFNQFFIAETGWHQIRPDFFKRSGLPQSPDAAFAFLTERLTAAYDRFIESLPDNAHATVDECGWNLSTDNAEKLSSD